MTMRALELESCTVTFIDEDIVHTHFKDDHLVSVEDVQRMFEAIEAEHAKDPGQRIAQRGANRRFGAQVRLDHGVGSPDYLFGHEVSGHDTDRVDEDRVCGGCSRIQR